MRTMLIATALALATTAAQAEIICTHHGGCHETGMKLIYGDGGGVSPNNTTLNSYRTGKKVKVQIAGPSPSTERKTNETRVNKSGKFVVPRIRRNFE